MKARSEKSTVSLRTGLSKTRGTFPSRERIRLEDLPANQFEQKKQTPCWRLSMASARRDGVVPKRSKPFCSRMQPDLMSSCDRRKAYATPKTNRNSLYSKVTQSARRLGANLDWSFGPEQSMHGTRQLLTEYFRGS